MSIDPTDPAPSTRDLATGQPIPSPVTTFQPETARPTGGTVPDDSSVAQGPPSFGDYDLLHVAGEGGMGVVYQARQRSSGRVIALKVMRQRASGTPDAVIRFRREVRIGDLLRHPHIAAANDAGETDGRLFYTMTYAPTNLWRQRHRFFDPRRAARLMVQVARAVHYAHVLGVMHRDLKPSNILLTASDEPLIADFGLARWVDASQDLTEAGALLGTTHYMAPEQAAGSIDCLTGSVDIWAMGVILCELLTGQRPFEGDGADAILNQVRFSEPAPPRQFRAELDANLEAIVLRCLRKTPSERYVTAAALADALERWLAGLPTRESAPLSATGSANGKAPKRLLAIGALIAAPALLTFGALRSAPSESAMANRNVEPAALRDKSQADAIANELWQGQQVVLVPQRGWPRYFRNWIEQGNRSPLEVPRDSGVTTVSSKETKTLIELSPKVPCAAYIYESQIRHRWSKDLEDRVGLYFGLVNWRTADGLKLNTYCRVILNDLHDVSTMLANANVPHDPNRANLVRFEVALHAVHGSLKGTSEILTYQMTLEGGEPVFLPAIRDAALAGNQWRRLAIAVQPDTIGVYLDGKFAGRVPTETIQKASGFLLRNANFPPDAKAVPDMSASLGLTVARSVAEFHSVTLTPQHKEK